MIPRRQFLRRSTLAAASLPAALLHAQGRLPAPPTITAKACIVIDAVTGAALFEKDADEKRAVASTQKLLSALVAVESTSMDKITTVQLAETKVEPHKLYLKVGEKLPLRTVLEAMLIESCNDCAHCMARSCAGTESQFSVWMNRRAAKLGMSSSHFVNASGLPAEGQYSTARDMSRAARAAFFNPIIRGIVGRGEITITRGDGRQKKLQTTNYLLRRGNAHFLPICTGMKTGYTNAAGKCLISSATYRGRTVICVILGSSSKVIWKESASLLNWALGLSGS
jgi:D-alanyl-D-alanine carboxypeptidase (penicillin-binding protein 5/6)